MAGNNSINGQETVTFTDNMSFDGTERGGKLDTDGQVWLGSSTAPHVRKSSLISDGSLSITYTEPDATTANLEVGINGPVSVSNGGTGKSSSTAYTVQCGGTTTTAPLQSIASVGTSGKILLSNGAGALPTFETASSAGGPVFISKVTISNDATVEFTSGIDSTYNIYLFIFDNVHSGTFSNILKIRTSSNAGSSFDSGASDYAYSYMKSVTVVSSGQSNATSEIETSTFINDSSESQVSGFIYLMNPASSDFTHLTGVIGGSNEIYTAMQSFGGSRLSTTTVDAIQFRGSLGNLTTGTITMYGLQTP